jgi:hypothetical protein
MQSVSVTSSDGYLTFQVGDHKIVMPEEGLEIQGTEDNFVIHFYDSTGRQLPAEIYVCFGSIHMSVSVQNANMFIMSYGLTSSCIQNAHDVVAELSRQQFVETIPDDWAELIFKAFHKYTVEEWSVPTEEDPYEGTVCDTEPVYELGNLPSTIIVLQT